ncbi:hypothetical protein [Arvimicrobium flavum]|uniref:hypothetical protein n=1 Tax=Arvimicrobium flavum TaxID=3393320 RepID=UPI00237BBD8F|nr:hypothetical protein [Mesorhizobium shangrilense]
MNDFLPGKLPQSGMKRFKGCNELAFPAGSGRLVLFCRQKSWTGRSGELIHMEVKLSPHIDAAPSFSRLRATVLLLVLALLAPHALPALPLPAALELAAQSHRPSVDVVLPKASAITGLRSGDEPVIVERADGPPVLPSVPRIDRPRTIGLIGTSPDVSGLLSRAFALYRQRAPPA